MGCSHKKRESENEQKRVHPVERRKKSGVHAALVWFEGGREIILREINMCSDWEGDALFFS